MPTHTAKIEIMPEIPDSWDRIRDIQYQVYRAANEIVSTQFFNDLVQSRIKEAVPGIDKDAIKESFTLAMAGASDAKGYSPRNISYKVVREKFPELPSSCVGALNAQVVSVYSNDKKEVMRGDRSIRSYRRNKIGIPIVSKSFTLEEEQITWNMSREEKIAFGIRYGRDRSNNRSIVKKILSGEYKFSDSQIKVDGKKMFLLLCYTFDPSPIALDPDVCVGVDVGVSVPAYVALSTGKQRLAIGGRDDILIPRLKMQAQRRSLQKALRHSTVSGGKGRKKKLKALNRMQDRERNFVRNVNHNISRRVIDFALKNNAGVIKMEKLSGISREESGRFILRNWSYFELQNMIEYKAKAKNIQVKYIDPAYTSQTCHVCGHQNKEQRLSQSEFVCMNETCETAGEVINADYNAAKNISLSTNFLDKKGKKRAVRRPKGEAKGTPQAINQPLTQR